MVEVPEEALREILKTVRKWDDFLSRFEFGAISNFGTVALRTLIEGEPGYATWDLVQNHPEASQYFYQRHNFYSEANFLTRKYGWNKTNVKGLGTVYFRSGINPFHIQRQKHEPWEAILQSYFTEVSESDSQVYVDDWIDRKFPKWTDHQRKQMLDHCQEFVASPQGQFFEQGALYDGTLAKSFRKKSEYSAVEPEPLKLPEIQRSEPKIEAILKKHSRIFLRAVLEDHNTDPREYLKTNFPEIDLEDVAAIQFFKNAENAWENIPGHKDKIRHQKGDWFYYPKGEKK
jgi:hypothetical protein